MAILWIIYFSAALTMELPPPSPAKRTFTREKKYSECTQLEQEAIELDIFYSTSKQLLAKNMVQLRYVKALKCFLSAYEKNKEDPEIMVHIKKMQVLLLGNEFQIQKINPNAPIHPLHRIIFEFLKKDHLSPEESLHLQALDTVSNPPRVLSHFNRLYDSMLLLVDKSFLEIKDNDESPERVRRNSMDEYSCMDLHNGVALSARAASIQDSPLAESEKERLFEAHDTYKQALDIFISTYQNKCYKAYPYITYALKDIIFFESTYFPILTQTIFSDQLYKRLETIHTQESRRKRESLRIDPDTQKILTSQNSETPKELKWQEFLAKKLKETQSSLRKEQKEFTVKIKKLIEKKDS